MSRPMPRSVAPLAAAALCAMAGPAFADEGPTNAMMVPVRALVAYMQDPAPGRHAGVYAAAGVTIVENFPPYLFSGRDAVARWEAGFRDHVAAGHDTELHVDFGPVQDYSVHGRRAFLTLPTTWTGRTNGRRFEETGAWSFVLERSGEGWRILGYGWGVTGAHLVEP